MQKRIFVLRRTTMPAVIVETHNALDPREAEAFEEPTVRRAFAFALGKGVEDALAGRAPTLPLPAPSGTSGQARSIDAPSAKAP